MNFPRIYLSETLVNKACWSFAFLISISAFFFLASSPCFIRWSSTLPSRFYAAIWIDFLLIFGANEVWFSDPLLFDAFRLSVPVGIFLAGCWDWFLIRFIAAFLIRWEDVNYPPAATEVTADFVSSVGSFPPSASLASFFSSIFLDMAFIFEAFFFCSSSSNSYFFLAYFYFLISSKRFWSSKNLSRSRSWSWSYIYCPSSSATFGRELSSNYMSTGSWFIKVWVCPACGVAGILNFLRFLVVSCGLKVQPSSSLASRWARASRSLASYRALRRSMSSWMRERSTLRSSIPPCMAN